MNISLNGFGASYATLKAGDTLTGAGDVVAITENLTCSPAQSNADFCGICTDLRGGYATVQLSGYCTLPYSGTAPTVGYNSLVADGSGGVSVAATGGRSLLVCEVNTTAETIGLIL